MFHVEGLLMGLVSDRPCAIMVEVMFKEEHKSFSRVNCKGKTLWCI
jgi:hypothetical protein